jgi:hypothetical protein
MSHRRHLLVLAALAVALALLALAILIGRLT